VKLLLVALVVALSGRVAGAVDVPGSGGRLQVGGYLDGLAVVATEESPEQRPQALLDLGIEGTAARWLRGRLELRSRVGGPFEGGHQGVFNLVHEFQNYSPSLEVSEAYGDIHLNKADFRLGIQKIAWGKLDGIPPTDVLNPRDYHDPLVQDVEERKIGIPALLGTYYLPDVLPLALTGLRATLVYVPIPVPSRLALVEERWFPRSLVLPVVHVPPNQVPPEFQGIFPSRIPVVLRTANHAPPRAFIEDGGIAARVGGTWRDMDWDVYHYTGPETGPNADLQAAARLLSLEPLPADIRINSRLRQKHDVIHMTGGDWSAAFGGLTVRAEGAYFNDRPYLRLASDLVADARRDLNLTRFGSKLVARRPNPVTIPLGELFPTLDSVEWGVGGDYLWHGFQPLVQVNQIVILDKTQPLLISDPETRFTGLLRRHFMSDRLELEVRGVYAIDRDWWFVFPRASYLIRDDLRVRLGYLAIGGPRGSLIGQFNQNDEVVMQARWSF
jgi:hypothetical protein